MVVLSPADGFRATREPGRREDPDVTRLHALDSVWLELERGGPPIATGLVSVLDGPAPAVADVRAMVADRLILVPSLTWVLQTHGVSRPQWRDGGHPDLGHHIRAARVGRSVDDLARFISHLMEQPMDRAAPLWEMVVVRGLADGQWAFVWRLHHSVADGIGARAVMGHFLDTRADGGPTLADASLAGEMPRTGGLRDDVSRLPGPIGRVVQDTVTGVASALRHSPDAAHAVADVIPRPPGPLTGPLSDRRRWVYGTADLAVAKQARRRLGASLNDVVLAAVATGFRALLRGRGEPTDGRTLRCTVPVSTRAHIDDKANNQVSLVWVDLPVGEMSSAERVARITRSMAWQKQAGTPMIAAALVSLADHLLPGAVQEAVVRHASWVPGWFADTLVTNVPGAQFPLYVMGRRLRHLHPLIPVDASVRITVGVVSHDGTLGFGITGDGVHAADVDVLLDGTFAGLREMAGAAPLNT